MEERRYVAISIKHSSSMNNLVLWGHRTEDYEKRCFAGYSDFARNNGKKCELYSLEDFQRHYGNGVIKCDHAVHMTDNLLKRYKKLDTVLVDEEEYKKYFEIDKKMNLGRAKAIFEQLESDKYSLQEKIEAIKIVLDMPTHNGVKKDCILDAFRWFVEQQDKKVKLVPTVGTLKEL